MLHNLKRLAVFRIGVFGANADHQTNELGKSVLIRTIASYASGLIKCWQCGNENSSAGIQFKCTKCQSLLELPDDVDNFQLLRVDKRFDIDTKTLTHQFRQIQNVLHPDKFSNSSEKEQNLSAEWSSLVNKAYKILLSPIQRAEYLLKSYNVQIPEGNTAANSEFLMEMMERNEEVDAAKTESDLLRLLTAVQKDCQICIDKLEISLSANNLAEAKEQLIVLRYLLSLENSIKEKGNSLGIVL
ncbi:iron-sulfur cluster co-chaperone protein HscB [Sitodiplosis mosellana]|uniref:iron-sulfur cluster co-chaperone protein HscB n=1 Tax=Sitodiplosis mosellana TaxID=263140 RepID=UPI0024444801|nr:iron-sulfur cluster co-chaperone protein HscB [Sitodiplosis mosellana]